ncbi:hypothetical protein HF576_06550 [Microbacterium sp. CFH 90308]|uniref:Uncharacterized protein n=1 Tax=Microbacterium salsuginis TaxID=2722803 RepID=A0ABX1KAI6_9MICO|nr:hypothetical protein [Microbacterium sp. CFH 90308]NLP83497.1 hypothetical protein [Microbacterium sp. CFH 90308]
MPCARAGRGVAVLLAGALLLAGCAVGPTGTSGARGRGSPEATTSGVAPTLPAGVTVELVQLRADVAPRQAQVHVTNGSNQTLTIGDVRVEDPRFDGPATRVVAGRTSTVPAGRSVDVRVQLPAVDCSAPEEGEPEVMLELVGEGEVTASATDPLGFVAPLHERECREERLTDAAALAFTGFQESAPGEAAVLELTVTPTGKGEATVAGVQATNLLDFGPASVDGAYPLDLPIAAIGTEPIVVKLPLVPFRCDPHAVQEDKRGTIFDVRVVVDGEPGEIELFVGDELRGRILSWVAAWCGFG